ncbi:asparagine synthase (glutamine-hydrolyzing) [Legionella londiniensis]|uniref:asparagine synthase (glutamine-hydrolyzing) n=1 Tax=Legionella londiniensis TaxID=45068 RepID=A0A0W0VND0_9GAMM|nr:asparagine synthase (glutamine-hydrolyzing) [Legionella londiniensis]KTD21582.1 asparagine synthetase, glutamine-hydrolyzing [Legionella londiniensis]STX93534.1 asparagine synthetase, glutamine-hydrolyzing [Legionella londiniensis]
MCGIVGVYGVNARARVNKMLEVLNHRGPDGNGLWEAHERLTLGHKRLAINDLTDAGSQPIVSEDGKLAVVVNGEIYNYPEVKNELERYGFKFRSHSDSEVVLHAWRKWGYASFIKFNGMFAIAIYDLSENELILVRDRLGIKPLYYMKAEDELIFSSEIKSILSGMHKSKTTVDPVGLNQYLSFQNYFGERTIYQNIKTLLPGHFLVLNSTLNIDIRAYWHLQFNRDQKTVSFGEAVENFKHTLNHAVKRHLMSDVPVASYLSSGFDSSSIAVNAAIYNQSLVGFTGKFSEAGWYDETTIAREIAANKGFKHVTVKIDHQDLPRVLDSLIYHLDQPRMGIGAFSQYCVAEQVRKTHKVILTGHGGDELFSGYPVFKFMQFAASLKQSSVQFFSYLSKVGAYEWPHLVYFILSSLRSKKYNQYLPVLNSDSLLKNALHSECARQVLEASAEEELIQISDQYTNQFEVLYSHYLQAYLQGLLVVEDKISMAHSLESRTPMLDNMMLELSLSLPQSIKLYQGQLKAVIKEAGRGVLPASLYDAPKRGFPTPLRIWLRGPLRDWFVDKLTGKQSALNILFKKDWLNKVCHSYLNSPRQRFRPLDEIQTHRMWQLLSLESWLRINLNNNYVSLEMF